MEIAKNRPLGMGCMRLSATSPADDSVNEDDAIRVIQEGLSAGVTMLDTAAAYGRDDRDLGANERLIARALSGREKHHRPIVVTKGGMTRPKGRWVPDGRGKSIRVDCERSLSSLAVQSLDLLLLHAVDPRVPLATSVRALAKLRDEGLAAKIGLCNVNATQLIKACELAPIAAVQVELSYLQPLHLQSGVAAICRDRDIMLIAHSPLGGPKQSAKIAKNAILRRIAGELGVSPFDVALAWLRDLDPCVVSIAGPTRVESARANAAAQTIVLSAEHRDQLDQAHAAGARFKVPTSERRPPIDREPTVTLVVGFPASGKTTLAKLASHSTNTTDKPLRLNRDERGGTLKGLAEVMTKKLAEGASSIVLDNTYGTRASRNEVIERAWTEGANVACQWMTTSVEESQINACMRMVQRHGRLLGPDEIRSAQRKSPNTFGPNVLFRHRRDFEPPNLHEGFVSIEPVEFIRQWPDSYRNRALIVEYDGVLRKSASSARSPTSLADLRVLPGRAELLARYRDDGWALLGISWQPGIAEEKLTRELVASCFDETHSRLAVEIDVLYCPHAAGPPRCWCRKPLPGLGVTHIVKHKLRPSECIFVGRNPTDKTFAERLNFGYRDATEFFAAR